MKEYIWNGEIDCICKDLAKLLITTSKKFTDRMFETTEFSLNYESKKLLTKKCMKRFQDITCVLADIIENGEYYVFDEKLEEETNAKKLNGWILLGSLTETTLQMFLTFYLDDYKNSKWKQWQNFEIEKVKTPIIEYIDSLVCDKLLTNDQAKSIKKSITKKIEEHTTEHHVENIMFDELIQLYIHLKLLDDDEICYLRIIQSNRNGIHSFQDRDIGNWVDLQNCSRFFCYLMEWIIFHLPYIPDEYYL